MSWGLDTQIGGTDPDARNVISANTNGIDLSTSGSNMSVLIEGNDVGTDVTGTLAEANSVGINVGSSPGTMIGGTLTGTGNVISGNTTGVFISGTSHAVIDGLYNVAVQGNLIGTNAAGTAAVGNGTGVQVANASNEIGGTAAGAGNVISGNTGDGVEIINATGTGNVVEGDYIGTDYTGTVALANGGNGVAIDTGASSNTIGGLTTKPGTGAGNVISGNIYDGVEITNAGTGNLVEGNLIGTNAAGTATLGNGSDGVLISTAPSNTIGGITASARNIISGIALRGIEISGAARRATWSKATMSARISPAPRPWATSDPASM